jgi:hypothetical protein
MSEGEFKKRAYDIFTNNALKGPQLSHIEGAMKPEQFNTLLDEARKDILSQTFVKYSDTHKGMVEFVPVSKIKKWFGEQKKFDVCRNPHEKVYRGCSTLCKFFEVCEAKVVEK